MSPYDVTGLDEGGKYRVRGRRCSDSTETQCGYWSDWVEATLNKLTTPEITVVPIGPTVQGHRQARVGWSGDEQTTTYEIIIAGTKPSRFSLMAPNHEHWDLNLDEYLVNDDELWFTLKAHRPTTNYASSEAVTIKVRDNPIERADGNSKGVTGGQANVTWRVPGDTTDLTFQYLDLGSHHTGTAWNPSLTGQWSDKSAPMNYADSAAIPITGLTLGNIYAITATYIESSGTKVFSGRPVYAWPARGLPARGSRVATYPYFGHWPDKTYTYRICEDTFPSADRTNWVNLINAAFAEWEKATNDLIETTHDPSVSDCGIGIVSQTIRLGVDTFVFPVWFLPFRTDKVNASVNEIYLVDVPRNGAFHLNRFIDDVRTVCVFFAPGCTMSNAYGLLPNAGTRLSAPGNGVDILFNKRAFKDERGVPHELGAPVDTAFNNCIQPMMPPRAQRPFLTALHEAGHALGTSGAFVPENAYALIDDRPAYLRGHPSIPGAVMNYNSQVPEARNEKDCSPHPFDVLAIYALYQTID